MDELLKKAASLGIIDADKLRVQVEKMEKQKYLNMHNGAVWQDSKGRWTTYLPETEGAKRKLIKKKDKVDLEWEIIDFYKQETECPTLNEVFEKWIQEKQENGEVTKQTADRYKTDAQRFFEEFGKHKMPYITEGELEDFIKHTIKEKGLTAKAWGNLRILIKGVFKYGKKRGYTKISITTFMGDLELSQKAFTKSKKEDSKSVFTDTEVKQILEEIRKEKPSLLTLGIELAFETGLRAGELATLKYTDLDGQKLNVSRTEIRYKNEEGYVFEVREATKGRDGSREIYITPEAVKIIKKIRLINPFEEYMFVKSGKIMHGHSFSDKICRLCRQAGITPKSLHKIRKTYATRLLNANVPEKLIIKQMGHTDIQTTKDYYWFNNMEEETAQKCIQDALGRG